MKVVRKILEIDEELCTGCGDCVPDCAEGSLKIIDGKARLVSDNLCDGLGACIGSCPTGALKIVEREAEEFDERAVEEFLKSRKEDQKGESPSTERDVLGLITTCQAANRPISQKNSNLSNWPVQIRLIQPSAPFLEDSHILIAADCTAVACNALQQEFVKGRVVMMGCPKFDDQQMYVERLTEFFIIDTIKTVTILIMDVPCCSSMLGIVKRAFETSKSSLPISHFVISREGKILEKVDW